MRIARASAAMGVAIFLSGCAQGLDKGKLTRDIRACDAKYPLHIGNYFRHASCVDSAEFNYSANSPAAFAQATDRASARDILAKRVDSGEISPADAGNLLTREFARARGVAVSEDAQRRREAAAIMLQSGAFQSHPYQAPVYQNMMGVRPLQTQPQVNCTSNAIGQTLYTNCR